MVRIDPTFDNFLVELQEGGLALTGWSTAISEFGTAIAFSVAAFRTGGVIVADWDQDDEEWTLADLLAPAEVDLVAAVPWSLAMNDAEARVAFLALDATDPEETTASSVFDRSC